MPPGLSIATITALARDSPTSLISLSVALVPRDQPLDLDPRDMGQEMVLRAAKAARRDDERDDDRRQGENAPK